MFFSLLSPFCLQADQEREEDRLGISLWVSRIFKTLFPLVSFVWRRWKEGSPRPPARTSPSPSDISTVHRPRPPVADRRPAGNPRSTPPSRDRSSHLPAPWTSPLPSVDAMLGQDTTDRRPNRHLAARPTLTQGINSLNQTRPSPTEHATPTKPIRRDRAARARRACIGVPVRQHLF
jgi:hypothetical protein